MGNWKYQIYDHLSLNGDLSTLNANVDGSGTAQSFYITPSAKMQYVINRMMVFLRDNQALAAEDYGAISGGLTNGLTVNISNSSQVLKTLTQLPIKTNADWNRMCHDADPLTYGNGDNYISVRWTFGKAGLPIILDPGERLEVLIQDDCAGLLEHYYIAEGKKLPKRQKV